MDRVAARNALIILIVIGTLTVMSMGVLLYQYADGVEPSAGLVGIVTTLLGFLTGTQVSFGAKPAVNATAKVAEDALSRMDYNASQALDKIAAIAPVGLGAELVDTSAGPGWDDVALAAGDVDSEEYFDEAVPEVETDAAEAP